MTDENKIVEVKEEKCLCQSKAFRKFVTIALGTFVGVFCALSLFAALHKPPMMTPAPYGPMMRPCHCGCHHHFNQGHQCYRGDFHKKMMKEKCGKKEVRHIENNEIDD